MWRQIDLTDNKCLSLSRGGFGIRNSELCLFVEECKNYRKQEKVQQCQSDETDLNVNVRCAFFCPDLNYLFKLILGN